MLNTSKIFFEKEFQAQTNVHFHTFMQHALKTHQTILHPPSPSSHSNCFMPLLLSTPFLTHKFQVSKFASRFHKQSKLSSHTIITFLLNLSTGEKPKGEEDEAERSRWRGEKSETQRKTVKKSERTHQGQADSVGEVR